NYKQALLRHLAHRVPDALAAVARALRAAVGHLVDAERVDVVDDQRADLEALERPVDDADVVREEPGLQAELRRVRARERLVHVRVRRESDDRRERLLGADALLLTGADEQ